MRIAVVTLSCVLAVILLCWVTWTYVLTYPQQGFFIMLWGTLTGTGSIGGQ